MSRITITQAKELAQKSNQEIVVIFGYDKDGVQHVATWGRNKEQCSSVADFGNKLKDILGWPDSMHQQPSRVRKLQGEVERLSSENSRLLSKALYAVCSASKHLPCAEWMGCTKCQRRRDAADDYCEAVRTAVQR